MRRALRLLATALAVAVGLTASPAVHGAFRLRIEHSPSHIKVGQVSIVTIYVQSANSVPEFKPPVMPDVSFFPVGKCEKVMPGTVPAGQIGEAIERLALGIDGTIANKAAKVPLNDFHFGEYVMHFKVQPEHAGRFVIEPFSVKADNLTAHTSPFNLCVDPSGPPEAARFEWSLSKANPKAGEAVDLYVDVLVERHSVSVNHHSYSHWPFRNILVFLPTESQLGVQFVKPLEQIVKERATPPGQVGFHLDGFVQCVLFTKEEKADGLDPKWVRYRLPIPVKFTKNGATNLVPFRVIGEIYSPWPEVIVGTKRQRTVPKAKWLPFDGSSVPRQVEVQGPAA